MAMWADHMPVYTRAGSTGRDPKTAGGTTGEAPLAYCLRWFV